MRKLLNRKQAAQFLGVSSCTILRAMVIDSGENKGTTSPFIFEREALETYKVKRKEKNK